MTVTEIERAVNRITDREMIFAVDCNNRYYLMINGINQKSSDNREIVENLFNHLRK